MNYQIHLYPHIQNKPKDKFIICMGWVKNDLLQFNKYSEQSNIKIEKNI